jgi:hypothetical protein
LHHLSRVPVRSSQVKGLRQANRRNKDERLCRVRSAAESCGLVRHDPRPVKITFGEMRAVVVGILVYCADYKCSHAIAAPADRWGDASEY